MYSVVKHLFPELVQLRLRCINSKFKLGVAGVFLVKLDVAAKILENSYIVETNVIY